MTNSPNGCRKKFHWRVDEVILDKGKARVLCTVVIVNLANCAIVANLDALSILHVGHLY